MNAFWRNPEFRRNLWLELSSQRLLLMPGLIALILFVSVWWLSESGNLPLEALAHRASVLIQLGFIGITVIWGSMRASNALLQEFSDGTWDSQRMSGLTAWQMVWGKWLGGTIYAWYGGAILLTLMIVAMNLAETPGELILFFCVNYVSLAVLMQVSALLSALVSWHKKPGNTKRSGMSGLLILTGLFLIVYLPSRTYFGFGPLFDRVAEHDLILWWGKQWLNLNFTACTFAMLAIWSLVGLWQAMRRELLLRNHAVCWPAFLLFWMGWGAGFVKTGEWSPFFAFCTLLTWGTVYLLLFFERKDQGLWLRLIAACKNKDKPLIRHLLPSWLASFILALALSLVTLASLPAQKHQTLLVLLSVAAFVTRDVAWTLRLNIAPDARRADSAAMVSLIVAYGVLPVLAGLISPQLRSVLLPDLGWVTGLVHDSKPLIIGLVASLSQAALAVWLLYGRWRKVFG
ncbi:MAG: hypothetical protein LBU46_08685 [Candidatus Accumulibacter sp.]|jgi:hypothetical protein|nr:hypothetical protein [Accumulibacter sp.]